LRSELKPEGLLAKFLGGGKQRKFLRFRLQSLADEGLDLSPEMGIALALHVAGRESPVEPRHAFALYRVRSIVEPDVAQDLSLAIVGCPDRLFSV
jgi:hypothetical protein